MSNIVRRPFDKNAFARLKTAGLHPVLARVYAARETRDGVPITGPDDLIHDVERLESPARMKDLKLAAQLLGAAIAKRQRIVIVGDYDCDGATSTAILMSHLRACGADVDYLVPDRVKHGYGLTPTIVELAAEKQPDLLLTVDNGIGSIDGVAAAKDKGWTVIVTDHHLPGKGLPDADAIVNPNQPDCTFPWKGTAGCGVAFYLAWALTQALQAKGWFAAKKLPVPDHLALLDLVALGTIADVVSLEYNNRILVAAGLARMNAGLARPGLQALLELAGKTPGKITSSDMGFGLGPRLNAAGRLDDMRIGIECLLAPDLDAARPLALQLDSFNRERKDIEATMQAQALDQIFQTPGLADKYGICLFQPDWHQGVVGILASRVRDRLNRPVLIFADAGDGHYKASGRSVPGFHLKHVLDEIAVQHPDLLKKFGGHAAAAGLSIDAKDYARFADVFNDFARARLTPDLLEGRVDTDGPLEDGECNLVTADALRQAGPWGKAFPEPVFEGEFTVTDSLILKDKHLKLQLAPDLVGIQFNAPALNIASGDRVKLVYRLDVNEFRNMRKLQLLIDHVECVRVQEKGMYAAIEADACF